MNKSNSLIFNLILPVNLGVETPEGAMTGLYVQTLPEMLSVDMGDLSWRTTSDNNSEDGDGLLMFSHFRGC